MTVNFRQQFSAARPTSCFEFLWTGTRHPLWLRLTFVILLRFAMAVCKAGAGPVIERLGPTPSRRCHPNDSQSWGLYTRTDYAKFKKQAR